MSGAGATAGQRMYEQLRQAIEVGELTASQTLAEEHLASDFGVSRTPVREALLRLEQDGLVARSPRGYRLRTYSYDEIAEIYEARILLEANAARNAALRHSATDALRFRTLLEEMEDLARSGEDRERRVGLNRAYHSAIWEAAGNRTISELLVRIHRHSVHHTTLTDDARWTGAQVEHRRILAAITERDGDLAARLMEDHIAVGRDLFLSGRLRDASGGGRPDAVDPRA